MSFTDGVFRVILALENGTDFLGRHMKKMLFVGAIICVVVWWSELTAFVKGNTSAATGSVSQWLVDHTPKK